MRTQLRSLIALAISISGCGGYLRPPKPDQHDVFEAEVVRFESSNGFRFIVLPDPATSVVRLDVRYHVGAMFDPPGKEGLAHLVEHLMFQTKVKTSAGTMTVSQIQGGMAQWANASTDLDSTHYMAQVAPEQLATAFSLEVARLRLGCSSWDEATFLREREIVRNEIRNSHADAWGDVPRLLHEAAYPPGHPYRRTVGGSDASLANITLADVCAFVGRHYVAGNLTIVAAGHTTEAEIKRLAAEQLAAFPPAELRAAPRVALAPRSDGQMISHELDIDEAWLVALLPLPAEGTRDRRLVDIARAGITGTISRFAGRADWGHSASIEVIGGARAPLLAVSVSIRDLDDVGAARSAIATAMRRAVNDSRFIDDQRWRTPVWLHYKERLIAEFENFGSRPFRFADYEQFDDRELFVIGRLHELDEVTSAEIHQVGERFLDPDRATYVLFKPRPGARASGSGTFAYRPAAHDPESWRFPVDVDEADRALALPPNRPRSLPVVEHFLDNGLRVLLWPHGQIPLTYGHLVIAAGSADEPAGLSGLAGVVGDVVGYDVTTTGTRELSIDMDLVVERLSLSLRHGSTQNLDKWRERAAEQLALPHAARRAEYETAFRVALWGPGHPYSRGILTVATLDKIRGSDVSSFERDLHTAGNSTLILAGKFDPDLAQRHVRYQFGHLARKARGPRKLPPPAVHHGRQVVAVHGDAGSPVVDIDVAFPGNDGIDGTYAARLVLERVINARLLALREGLAVSYGMSAGYVPRMGPGEWHIAGRVDATRAVEAMAALQQVLDELRGDPAAWKADFVLARRKEVDGLLVAVTSPSLVASQLAFAAAFDLPVDYRDRLVEQLAFVTPVDLQRLIAAELVDEHAVFGLFGPEQAVDAAAATLR